MSPLSFSIKLLKEKKWEGGKVRGGDLRVRYEMI